MVCIFMSITRVLAFCSIGRLQYLQVAYMVFISSDIPRLHTSSPPKHCLLGCLSGRLSSSSTNNRTRFRFTFERRIQDLRGAGISYKNCVEIKFPIFHKLTEQVVEYLSVLNNNKYWCMYGNLRMLSEMYGCLMCIVFFMSMNTSYGSKHQCSGEEEATSSIKLQTILSTYTRVQL